MLGVVLLVVVCAADATSPLTGAGDHEAMCCLDAAAVLRGQGEEDAEVVDCEARPLNTLQQRLYGIVFGLETSLTARRRTDGRTVRLRLHVGVCTARWYGPSPEPERERVVVCTYNVWHFTPPYHARLAAIARLLRAEECDVVLLQELRMRWTFAGSAFLIADLARSFPGFSYDFRPAMAYLERRAFEMEGLGVLSRLPLLAVEAQALSNNATADPEDEHRRLLLRATVALGGARTLQLFNTHMSLSRGARLRNAAEIVAALEAAGPGPQLLAGDLNAEPDDPLYGRLLAGAALADVGQSGPTFQAWNLTKRIDFVLARRLRGAGLRAAAARTFGAAGSPETAPSDHLGVRVELVADAGNREDL